MKKIPFFIFAFFVSPVFAVGVLDVTGIVATLANILLNVFVIGSLTLLFVLAYIGYHFITRMVRPVNYNRYIKKRY